MSQSPDFILTLQRWCPRIPGLQTFSERNDSARAATAKARSSEQSGWKFMPIENLSSSTNPASKVRFSFSQRAAIFVRAATTGGVLRTLLASISSISRSNLSLSAAGFSSQRFRLSSVSRSRSSADSGSGRPPSTLPADLPAARRAICQVAGPRVLEQGMFCFKTEAISETRALISLNVKVNGTSISA